MKHITDSYSMPSSPTITMAGALENISALDNNSQLGPYKAQVTLSSLAARV